MSGRPVNHKVLELAGWDTRFKRGIGNAASKSFTESDRTIRTHGPSSTGPLRRVEEGCGSISRVDEWYSSAKHVSKTKGCNTKQDPLQQTVYYISKAGEMSPLHQLGHAEMLLRRPSAVTLTTELARPIRNLLLIAHDS
ncbi:hypothetical protein EYF80_014041 [Liparis tanakae]|uniref:Uncharacterized protein n=1 Tax=Liparis tanakae TaxID=230148 RepID=A0A4Z2ICB6_9TELE|nr:hypothetical protein EYF80_014041 [Liparis tanakae]